MNNENILEINSLFKELEDIRWNKKILDNVNLSIKRWRITWFLWVNWAWKTTTMKCIVWLLKPTKWTINFNFIKKESDIRKNIGYLVENTFLYKFLTWYEFLKITWNIFDINLSNEEIENLLKKVWLENDWHRRLSKYSKWMLQKISIASTLINDPELLIYDEPMSWLDPKWRKVIKNLILELKNKWKTIMMSTHVLNDIQDICDDFYILNNKTIIDNWTIKEKVKWSLENYFLEQIEK